MKPIVYIRACSSVWLERTPDKGEVGSSSLPRPTKLRWFLRGFSSAGRAPALQAGGHRFDPGKLHQVLSFSIYIVKWHQY